MPKKKTVIADDHMDEVKKEEVVPQEAVIDTEAPKKKTPKKDVEKPVAKATGKKPTTMDELLAMTGTTIHAPKRGSVAEGIVTDINRKMETVDIGGKTEGIVVDKEYDAAEDYVSQLHVGDKISVYIVSAENERGQILLSLKKASMDQKWDVFKKHMETGDVVEVRRLALNKSAMIGTFEGIRAFVPTSHF